MKALKTVLFSIIVLTSFTNCSTAQKLQKDAPMTFGEAYSQSWVAGVQGGGSGINLFIPVSIELPQNMQLDSVYFRGKVTKLQRIQEEPILYAAYLRTELNNERKDIVMSSDSKKEYGNKLPIATVKIPFELKNSECVISYKEGNQTKYFKIENIIEKQAEYYPSAPPNKQ